ncbi:MAG: hypothetical protein LUG61_10415 [Lachnospiraceae bacterium]|nr:hypothetical protein [Lachnospiraceae bacterium]
MGSEGYPSLNWFCAGFDISLEILLFSTIIREEEVITNSGPAAGNVIAVIMERTAFAGKRERLRVTSEKSGNGLS